MRTGRLRWLGVGALLLLTVPRAHAQPTMPVVPTEPTNGAVSVDAGGNVVRSSAPADAHVTLPPPAPGSDEPCVGDRFVVLEQRGFDPALAAEVRTDFAAELAHRGLSICAAQVRADDPREPAAVIEVEAADLTVVISLDDRVTHKRVARDLSLKGIPDNGRALAIAIAMDELLRASWAELTLRRNLGDDEDDEERTYVSETRTVNARGGRGYREPTRYHLGADLAYLHTSHSFDAFSLGARASVRPWGWGWFELSLAGMSSVSVSGSAGDVIAAGLRSAITAGACSTSRGRMFGCGGVRTEVDTLVFRGIRAEMARAYRVPAAVVHASLVGSLAVLLSEQSYLFGELGFGAVLHGAEATDGVRTLMGVTGMMFSLQLGVGYEL